MWILLFPVLFMFVFLGVIILVPIFTRLRKRKKRTQQLQATAAQLGWNFAASAPLNMIPGLERFALFNDGQQGRQIKNFMYGEASGIKAAVFDYLYLGGFSVGRRGRNIYATSVVYLETPYLRVPYFTLRPENFLTKIFTGFGYQDIDFGQRPEFSRQYILRGQDEQAIRQTFNDRLLSFYETYPGTCTDGGGNQLFVYRDGYRFQPQEIQSYVGLGLSVLNLFPRYQ